MKTARLLCFFIICLFLLVGCAGNDLVWTKSGTIDSDQFYRDCAECTAQARSSPIDSRQSADRTQDIYNSCMMDRGYRLVERRPRPNDGTIPDGEQLLTSASQPSSPQVSNPNLQQEEVSVTQPKCVVWYGANRKFYKREFAMGTNVGCIAGFFGGDPIPNVPKRCYIGSEVKAVEGAYFIVPNPCSASNLPVTRTQPKCVVWYGANRKFYKREFAMGTNVGCIAGFFGGDPIPGVPKRCYIGSEVKAVEGAYFIVPNPCSPPLR